MGLWPAGCCKHYLVLAELRGLERQTNTATSALMQPTDNVEGLTASMTAKEEPLSPRLVRMAQALAPITATLDAVSAVRKSAKAQDPTDSVSEPLHKHEMYSSSDTDESVSSKDGDSASDDEEQCWCTRCTHYTLTTHRRARHSQLENLPEAHFQTATVAANDPQQVRSDRPLTDEQLTQVTNAVAEAAAAVEGQELASGWLLV